MINLDIIEKAKEIGGKESWFFIKENMSSGQDFYTTDIGKITFLSFVENENEILVPIFRTETGLSSYDYFFRELLCGGSVFLRQEQAESKRVKSAINRMSREFKSDIDFKIILAEFISESLCVEVNQKDESKPAKILTVNDCFIGDNGTILLSVDDL